MEITNETERRLQIELASRCPTKLFIEVSPPRVRWLYDSTHCIDRKDLHVLDSEWLEICRMIEAAMTQEEYDEYWNELYNNLCHAKIFVSEAMRLVTSASWQQRAMAMARL